MKIVKAPFKWLASGFSGKTSWEWLELLIIPAGLAIGAFYLENRVEARQEKIAKDRHEQEVQIADEKSKQDTLTSYLEQMKDLLLEEKLRESSPESEVRSVARAITITTIKELDASRNELLVDFLAESNLTRLPDDETVDSQNKRVPLLRGLNLSGANLSDAALIDAELSDANLSGAALIDAALIDANLSDAELSLANLRRADMSNANLSNANLIRANLNNAFLIDVRLNNAELIGADLSGTHLDGADLSDSILSGAKGLTAEQLEAATLCNTTLPEGLDLGLDPNRDCEKLGIDPSSFD